MLRSSESETEILLGNKQLLGIFFVVAVLLGVAFVGGYKVGQAGTKKAAAPASVATDQTPASSGAKTSNVGETHALPAATSDKPISDKPIADKPISDTPRAGPTEDGTEPALGSAKRVRPAKAVAAGRTAPTPAAEPASYVTTFAPQGGQTFLQVAAVSRDEAEATADVLHKKGFRAHAVPKPGALKIYRVLIGPIRDAGDLASTRDSLHKIGFREIFVQRY